MVLSFSAALWSSAQIEHNLSCPSGVPPFMGAYFLFCKIVGVVGPDLYFWFLISVLTIGHCF